MRINADLGFRRASWLSKEVFVVVRLLRPSTRCWAGQEKSPDVEVGAFEGGKFRSEIEFGSQPYGTANRVGLGKIQEFPGCGTVDSAWNKAGVAKDSEDGGVQRVEHVCPELEARILSEPEALSNREIQIVVKG